jgi:hypothetical protein
MHVNYIVLPERGAYRGHEGRLFHFRYTPML